MNRVLRIDEEKPEMHISVQGYKVPSRFMRKIVCRLRLSEVSRQ